MASLKKNSALNKLDLPLALGPNTPATGSRSISLYRGNVSFGLFFSFSATKDKVASSLNDRKFLVVNSISMIKAYQTMLFLSIYAFFLLITAK
jgi:hypothetical protein